MSDELYAQIMKAIESINTAMTEVSKVSTRASECKRFEPLKYRANRIWHELHRAATDLRDSGRSVTEALPAKTKSLVK